MAASGIKKSDVLDELESHLRDEVESQVRAGIAAQAAFSAAAQRLGQTTVLNTEFEKLGRERKRLRRRLLARVGAGFRKHPSRFLGMTVGLFVVLAAFGYLVMLPLAIRANARYAAWLGISNPPVNMAFVCRFVLGICLGLILPVGMVALARNGVVNHRQLGEFRPYVIVANLILGALLTTPEVVTQIVIFVPLQLLCELAVLTARIWERRAQRHS